MVRAVRQRDNDECQLRYPGCTGDYEELDHTRNVASLGITRREASTVDNLQCVCVPCHRMKSQREAAAGRVQWRRQPERHPGLVP